MKKVLALVILILVCTGIYAGVSPYIAAYQLHQAYKSQDVETINEYIDYPALRSNLKQQMLGALKTRMSEVETGNMPPVPDAFIESMITPAIDALTPEVLASMVESQFIVGRVASAPFNTPEHREAVNSSDYHEVFNKIRYTGLNSVSVVHTDEKTQARIEADLERRGLGHWQVINVQLS